MLCEKLEGNFINVLKEMKLYHSESDTIEIDRDQNLIEVSHKNGNIYSFYLDPVKMNGAERELRLVGATETDPSGGKISYESPLGEALVGATGLCARAL